MERVAGSGIWDLDRSKASLVESLAQVLHQARWHGAVVEGAVTVVRVLVVFEGVMLIMANEAGDDAAGSLRPGFRPCFFGLCSLASLGEMPESGRRSRWCVVMMLIYATRLDLSTMGLAGCGAIVFGT